MHELVQLQNGLFHEVDVSVSALHEREREGTEKTDRESERETHTCTDGHRERERQRVMQRDINLCKLVETFCGFCGCIVSVED